MFKLRVPSQVQLYSQSLILHVHLGIQFGLLRMQRNILYYTRVRYGEDSVSDRNAVMVVQFPVALHFTVLSVLY